MMNKNDILIALSASRKEDFTSQSLPQKFFTTIWAVESEVNNGGFSQYFANRPETVPFVADALDTIGAPMTAGICRRAIGLPDDELQELDAEFLAYPLDLTELLYAYVAQHPEEFGPLPE